MRKAKSNAKMIFNHLCEQLQNLSDNKIDVDEAKAHASLAKQANNLLKYELDRAVAIAKYGDDLDIRTIEE